MTETYCGKSCAECAYKEVLSCPGCHAGPGRSWSGDCELARCIREKGHETCQTCGFRDRCGTLASRERMPVYRIKKAEAERIRAEAVAKRAPVLGKWLWLLFWLIVPNTAASIIQMIPAMEMPGEILAFGCNLATGLILLKLAAEDGGYRVAGICTLITSAVNLAATLVFSTPDGAGWALIFTVPATIVGLVGTHREFMAHAAVLGGVDNALSENWEKLWKWYIGAMLSLLGSVILMPIVPVLGILVILAAAIAVIVVSILRLVYLYKTAKAFRYYCQKAE